MADSNNHFKKVSAAGLLVTLGIIFGDIGTSPLYVLKAIVGEIPIDKDVVLGGLSCIFWTLTIQTTIKYVLLTLQADNKGEGGIFALYALVKRTKIKWLLIPAIIGGSALLADGIITPPISVASAIEGLRVLYPEINTVPIVIAIIVCLFAIQQFGTKLVGNFFGPVMLVWFVMLGLFGSMSIFNNSEIIKAINPYYAYKLLVLHPGGFWLLGAVFLCTTGAEALYSDLGHCGKSNIRISWVFVKTMLLLNYFGQGAWLISHHGSLLNGSNPFYSIMPDWFVIYGIAIATAAAVVASQALISGSFTLINEAIRLNIWPKVRTVYPTELRGQIYIPSINWLLCAGCVMIVLYFKESSNMEAAYGLAIVLTMLMTTTLLAYFLYIKRYSRILIIGCITMYLIIEGAFLVANLSKFSHGGWITLLIAAALMFIMLSWNQAKKIRDKYVAFVKMNDYVEIINALSIDLSVTKYSTHLIYLTSAAKIYEIEQKIIYSILQKQPKRADIYWFLHINVVDEPYRMEYKVTEIAPNDIIRIDFYLGFRIAPRINLMFRKVIEDMVNNKEVDITSRYESLQKQKIIGDFKFVVLEKFLSYDNDFPFFQKLILNIHSILKKMGLSEEKAFGLDTSSVTVEKVPLVISPARDISNLKRIS